MGWLKQKIVGFSLFMLVLILYLIFAYNYENKDSKIDKLSLPEDNKWTGKDGSQQEIGLMPITFVGGTLRTGTTLMRTMLDAHPDITCGPETWMLPKVLETVDMVLEQDLEFINGSGLLETGKYGNWSILDQAMQQFIYTLVVKGKRSSKYYCNKDPFNLLFQRYISTLFPKSKFILMLRDLRAVAYSWYNNKFPPNWNYRIMFAYLNDKYEKMISQCEASDQCIMQKYEQLVLQPIKETKKIFNFLNIPWAEEVLHYDQHSNETIFNSNELTTKDVQKPLYLDGLTKWIGKLPNDVLEDVEKIAPIIVRMGYDANDKAPFYGEADDFVLKQVGDIRYHQNTRKRITAIPRAYCKLRE